MIHGVGNVYVSDLIGEYTSWIVELGVLCRSILTGSA
jgi:hypothetical protein